jgi:hypothetical protein
MRWMELFTKECTNKELISLFLVNTKFIFIDCLSVASIMGIGIAGTIIALGAISIVLIARKINTY